MKLLEFVRQSNQLYYVRTDAAGRIIDTNELFRINIDILNAQDSNLAALTNSRGIRILHAAAARARQSDWPVSIQVQLKQHDHSMIWTAWEIDFSDGEYQLLGFDLFKIESPDSVKLRKQAKLLREIAWIQSHLVRRPVANILGLVPLVKKNALTDEDKRIVEMLDQATKEFDEIIKRITALSRG